MLILNKVSGAAILVRHGRHEQARVAQTHPGSIWHGNEHRNLKPCLWHIGFYMSTFYLPKRVLYIM